MDIRKTDSRYEYSYRCNHCGSHLAIYPSDCVNVDYETIPSTLNRRMHLKCPICCNDIEIYLDDTPCFFKSVMARKRGWKVND